MPKSASPSKAPTGSPIKLTNSPKEDPPTSSMKSTNNPTVSPSKSTPATRKLASDAKVEEGPQELSSASEGLPLPVHRSRRRTTPAKRPSTFLDPGPICNKEVVDGKIGQADFICPDLSSDKFNCCYVTGGDYSCESCAACHGWGQILDGIDEMGHSW